MQRKNKSQMRKKMKMRMKKKIATKRNHNKSSKIVPQITLAKLKLINMKKKFMT